MSGTDSSPSPNEIEEIRARFRLAGLLSDFDARDVVLPEEHEVAAARQRAGQGTPLSELVCASR